MTPRTMDFTVCQGHLNLHPTAMRRLAGVCRIDSQHSPTSIPSFVGRALHQLCPTGIGYTFGQTVVLDHPSDIQLLKNYQPVTDSQIMAQLMGKIFALIGDPFVNSRHYYAPLLALFT